MQQIVDRNGAFWEINNDVNDFTVSRYLFAQYIEKMSIND